jgi:hypothetical protein
MIRTSFLFHQYKYCGHLFLLITVGCLLFPSFIPSRLHPLPPLLLLRLIGRTAGTLTL